MLGTQPEVDLECTAYLFEAVSADEQDAVATTLERAATWLRETRRAFFVNGITIGSYRLDGPDRLMLATLRVFVIANDDQEEAA